MLIGTLQFARMEGLSESHSSPLVIDLRGWEAWVETRRIDRGRGAGCLEVKGAGRASAWASIAVLPLAVLVGLGSLGAQAGSSDRSVLCRW